MFRLGSRRAILLALAFLIIAFGSLLRLDAFVQKYGTLEHPAWARVLTHRVAPIAASVRPAVFRWQPEPRPYLGGDPINYLRYAREMTSFYQPHVREPIFLALTRASLWLVRGQDQGLSLASASGSVLTIAGVCLLGAALRSCAVGLAAAVIAATEFQLIMWAPDGWRDDTFMATVVFAAWAFLRFGRMPSFTNALLLGGATGLACLTRITALSFVLPGLAWVLLDGSRAHWRSRWRLTALAGLVSAAIVAPYLVSCAIATGDPLYAVNYHTGYYRYGEGLPWQRPMSAAEYVHSRLAARPLATIDVAATGIFVQPFTTKWNGIDPWLPGLAALLRWSSLAGLFMLLFSNAGRLFLVLLVTSLLPYAVTWNVAGGGEWRFTMHAYPFFIVAAFYAIDRICRAAQTMWHLARRAINRTPEPRTFAPPDLHGATVGRPSSPPSRPGFCAASGGQALGAEAWSRSSHAKAARPRELVVSLSALRRVAIVLAVAANIVAVYLLLPSLVVREAIAHGEDVSIETGGRDFAFFGAGWSEPHRDGVTVRVSRAPRASVHIPLPSRRAYDVVIRMDPVAPERQDRLTVLFNRRLLAIVHLGSSPDRMGSYPVHLQAADVVLGRNELMLVPEATVSAGSLGPRFSWLDPRDQIGVRLWYVRILGQ